MNIINYYKQFYSGTKNTEIIGLQNIIDSINKSPLTEFYSQKETINEYLKHVETAKKRIKLINSIIFMGIYSDKKNKFEGQDEEELFQNSNKQFEKLKDIGNIEGFDKEFKILIGESFKGKVNEIMKEINFIFSYFGLVENHKLKENIKLTIIEIIDEHISPKPDPRPKPVPYPIHLDSFLKDVKESSDSCIYFYNKYKNEDTNENKIIVDKLKLFSEIIFKSDNQEKVKNSEEKSFLFIIKQMLIACLICFNINNRSIN